MTVKRIAQFRYYGENSPYNFPENMLEERSGETVCPGVVTLLKYKNISWFNITTVPGTILYIYLNDSEHTILKYIVGATGTLNLDLEQLNVPIRGVTIEKNSVEIIKANPENYFVLTIVYEVEVKEAED